MTTSATSPSFPGAPLAEQVPTCCPPNRFWAVTLWLIGFLAAPNLGLFPEHRVSSGNGTFHHQFALAHFRQSPLPDRRHQQRTTGCSPWSPSAKAGTTIITTSWPPPARVFFYWWEIDLTYYGLKLLSWFPLSSANSARVPDHVLAEGQAFDASAA